MLIQEMIDKYKKELLKYEESPYIYKKYYGRVKLLIQIIKDFEFLQEFLNDNYYSENEGKINE